jgi:hypothetical protein
MILDFDAVRQLQGELHNQPATYELLCELNHRVENLMKYLNLVEVMDVVGFKFAPNPEKEQNYEGQRENRSIKD